MKKGTIKLFAVAVVGVSLYAGTASAFAATVTGGSATRYIDNVTAQSVSVRQSPDISQSAIYTLYSGADTVRYYGNEGTTSMTNGGSSTSYQAYYAFYPRSGAGSYNSSNVGYVTYTDGTSYFSNEATGATNNTSSADNIWASDTLSGSVNGTVAAGAQYYLSGGASTNNPNAWAHLPAAYQASDGWVNGWYSNAF